MGGKQDRRQKNRLEYSAINAGVAMVAQALIIVAGYISRVVFTRTLSASYAGVNGLFADILGVLSLSELGIASAMSYALYRPIAENDIPKIQAVMKLYKRLYICVAAFVGTAGLGMLPFLGWLAGDLSAIGHLELIYLLYLGNSVASYLLMYRGALITAHQKAYIVSIYSTAFSLAQIILQIILLLTTRNYIAYLLVSIVGSLLCNFCISRLAGRMYPYLGEKNDHELPPEEKQEIRRNIWALAMHRLGAVVINNTDNMLLSRFAGLVSAGVYSNYYLVINSVRQVLTRVFQGMAASVGNLGATEDREAMERVFYNAFFIGQWIYALAAICLYELLQPFIELSFGAHYLFDRSVVLILCVLLFLQGMRNAVATFWYALGKFWLDRYKALAEAVLNLVISIFLGSRYGVAGIFMGTILSMLLVPVWVDPYMFFHHCLNKSPAAFAKKYAGYLLVIGLTWWLVDVVCGQVTGSLVRVLLVRMAICAVMPNVLFLAAHFRRKEFRNAVSLAMSLLKKRNGAPRHMRAADVVGADTHENKQEKH